MTLIVTIERTDGTMLRREFCSVEEALGLVSETLRRWADNTLTISVVVVLESDTLGMP